MKSMRLIAPALVAVSLLVVSMAWAQGGNPPASTKESKATSGHGMTAAEQIGGNVEEQIKTLQEEGRQAALKGDTSWQQKCLADNFIGIGGDGRMFTKAESIQMLKSGAIKYEGIDEHDVKVRVYGNTAVVKTARRALGVKS